ncbi:MAG TPA: NAD(P)-dependent oxidoreductase [Actinomycetota bacterium]
MRILSLAPLAGPALARLRALGDLELDPWIDHVPIKLHAAGELLARLAGVDVLIVEADFIPVEVFEGSSLRFLCVCRGDPNNVDMTAATRREVTVIRTPGRNAEGVAELAVALMLALLRSIVAADDDVRAGRWVVDERIAQQRYRGRELRSCSVGLVGFGAVGRATARKLLALGARVLASDPMIDADDMRAGGVQPVGSPGELFEASDIVSVHAPLNDATRGMLDAAIFARLRPGSYFVNTARYDIADEQALLDALADGRLAGAALDHFHHEFLPADHPLTSMPNVVLTPHIGGTTVETIETHTAQIADGLEAVLAGEVPSSVVNPEVLRAST